MIFSKSNLDTYKILKAASTKWNFLNFQPGLVGGHCVSVDPYYLTYKSRKAGYDPKIILSGRKVNNAVSKFICDKTFKFNTNIMIKILNLDKTNIPNIFENNMIDDNLKEKFDDYITFIILGIIIGGRLGYVIFYNLDYYLENIFEIFKIWNGGMSFHGGLLGVIVMSVWFAKKHNHNSYIYLDIVSLVAPIGIFFGRIANFINSELYGYPTKQSWGVVFPTVDDQPRHPSQLYEALLEGLLLFLILNIVFKFYRYKEGKCSYLFLFFVFMANPLAYRRST